MTSNRGGYTKVGDAEKSATMMTPCLMVYLSMLCLFSIQSSGYSLVFQQFAYLIIMLYFAYAKYFVRLWHSFWMPLVYALWESLRTDLHFKWYLDLPCNDLCWQIQKKGRLVFYGNFAFGGRGPAYMGTLWGSPTKEPTTPRATSTRPKVFLGRDGASSESRRGIAEA